MFYDREDCTKLSFFPDDYGTPSGVFLFKGFYTDEECKVVEDFMANEDTRDHPYEDTLISWYSEKLSPPIPGLHDLWEKASEMLYPEYVIHPQNNVLVLRPYMNEGMFTHSDSPGKGECHRLSQVDVWQTCCELDYGLVAYFGDFEGGEIFYPNIEADGRIKDRPGDPDDCLQVDVRPGDVAIHGATHPWEHGVRKITSGIRFAYSNFCMEKEHAPGTYELFNPEKHPLMTDPNEIKLWNNTVYPETTFCKKKCICGQSADLPYCDNTHKIINRKNAGLDK